MHIRADIRPEGPNCECGEEPQTPIHILTRCTRLAGLRTASAWKTRNKTRRHQKLQTDRNSQIRYANWTMEL